jgi:hypothetical protein
MRRQIKNSESLILSNSWKYGSHSEKIREALLTEQNHICTYTETFFGRSDTRDIEHFNPKLKGTDEDGYHNWFLVKHQWNSEKSIKWDKFQPILSPMDDDFEKRVVYEDGYYDFNIGDKEAENLIKLLKLDDLELARERKEYVNGHREDMTELNIPAQLYFDRLMKRNPNRVYFIRAIEEEFKIKINFPESFSI